MNVVIPYDEYIDLIACQMCCDRVDRDGVDNWEWYRESIKDFFREEEE